MFFFAFIAGYFFWAAVRIFITQSLQATLGGQAVPMSVDDWVIRSVLSNVAVVGLFMIPMITMRLFAEEKRTGTIELLATSPLRDLEIIVGKWLAAVGLYAAMLALSLINVAILYLYGKPSWKPLLIGYLGLLLQGSCMLAWGTFLSSLTKNQIIAAVFGFGSLLVAWVISWTSSLGAAPTGVVEAVEFGAAAGIVIGLAAGLVAGMVAGREAALSAGLIIGPAVGLAAGLLDGFGYLSPVLGYLSINDHFENFSRGVLSMKDAIFYVSIVVFGLFLTARSLESMRWRA
jgi:ABC-2 type transport system permease protein